MFKKFTLPYLVILVSFLLQVSLVFLPNFHFLILNLLPDDAFYYFNIARNIVNGYDSTFDEINLTNGYHPLWMLLILPIFKFFSLGNLATNNIDISPIYFVLSLSIFFSFLTIIVFSKILNKFTNNNYIISLVLFATFFNPYFIYSTLNGLETSLLLFALSLFVYFLLKMEKENTLKHNICFGVVAGFLILSRLDMIFVAACGYLYLIYKYLWKQEGWEIMKKNLNLFFVSSLLTAIIFFTWQIFNYLKFGMFLTTASNTITYVNHQLTYSDNGSSDWFVFLKTVIYMFDRGLGNLIDSLSASVLVLPLVGVAMYFFAKEKFEKLNPIWFVGAGLFFQMLVSLSLRWHYRDWYFIPHLLIFSLVVCYALVKLEKEFVERSFNYFLLFLLFCFSGYYYIAWEKNLRNKEIMQDTIWKAATWQNTNLPAGSKIGVFNSGIAGYFSAHTVYNLDGQVNSLASKHMLEKQMWQYIKSENLDYLADFPQYFTYRFKNFFGISQVDLYSNLELVQVVSSNGNDINIYKIKK